MLRYVTICIYHKVTADYSLKIVSVDDPIRTFNINEVPLLMLK